MSNSNSILMSARSRVLVILSIVSVLWSSQCIAAFATSLEDATNEVFQQHQISRVPTGADAPRGAGTSFTFVPSVNLPEGDSYVIITDHTDPVCLSSLNKLAQFHSGKILQIRDFRNLYKIPAARASLVERLRKAKPQYVAIAPRIENFSENTMLAVWQVLLAFGEGKLNVYPGYLVASDSNGLNALVARSIASGKLLTSDLNPVVIAQATDQQAGGMRAVEKAALMEDLFHELGMHCPGLVVRTKSAPPPLTFPKIGTLGTMSIERAGVFIQQFSPQTTQAIAASRLLLLFGHGSPGMTCSLSSNAFRNIPMENAIVLCGSCFSCTPPASDLLKASNSVRPESLAFRVVANGAQVFWGHMHENSGFPQLFVVFESLMKGETVGQSYQQAMNCVLPHVHVPQDHLIMTDDELADDKAVNQRNGLMFVMIGDPAAHPITKSE